MGLNSSSEPLADCSAAPPWCFCVAAVCIAMCEFAVGVWLPASTDNLVFGILFLPGTAIVASFGGLAPGALALAVATLADAYFLSGRHWIQLPTGARLEIVAGFAALGLVLAAIGALIRALGRDAK